jgi:hypothetical protein
MSLVASSARTIDSPLLGTDDLARSVLNHIQEILLVLRSCFVESVKFQIKPFRTRIHLSPLVELDQLG